jgi:hypothetical protein
LSEITQRRHLVRLDHFNPDYYSKTLQPHSSIEHLSLTLAALRPGEAVDVLDSNNKVLKKVAHPWWPDLGSKPSDYPAATSFGWPEEVPGEDWKSALGATPIMGYGAVLFDPVTPFFEEMLVESHHLVYFLGTDDAISHPGSKKNIGVTTPTNTVAPASTSTGPGVPTPAVPPTANPSTCPMPHPCASDVCYCLRNPSNTACGACATGGGCASNFSFCG